MTREDAIEIIRKNMPSDKSLPVYVALQTLVPELAESEDEKIRRGMIDEIKAILRGEDLGFPPQDVLESRLAYLEKQKEHELTEEDKKIIPEALVMLCDDIINHRVHTPIKTDEEGARKIKAFLKTFNRQPHKTRGDWEKQKEQKPLTPEEKVKHPLYIEGFEAGKEVGAQCEKVFKEQKPVPKFSVGDYVIDTNYKGEPLYQIVGIDKECYICEYRGDKEMGDRTVMHFTFNNPYLRLEQKPAEIAPNQFDGITYGMQGCSTEKSAERFEEAREKYQVEWSEEDKEKLKAICTYLRDYSRLAKLGDKLRFNEYCDFLESLRPQGSKDSLQPHWKPSEEQMEAFKKYIEEFQARAEAAVGGWNNFDVMIQLYEQLKKL